MLLLPPALVAPQTDQPAITLDLPGALGRAKAENALLKAAAARVEERRSLITTARADALPQLTAIGDFTRTRDVSILNSGFADSAAAFGLNPSSLVGARSVYTAQVNLVQPLFAWGKIQGAVDVAKVSEVEARFAYTTAELDILHGVAKAYVGVLMAQAQLDVVKVRLEAATKLVEDIQNKLDAQSATRLDLLRAQAELEGVRPEALQAQANHQRALEVLNGQLGLDPRTSLSIASLPPAEVPVDLQGVERSELSQLKEQEKGYRINDQILTSDLRPRLDFSASAGYQAGKTDNLFKEPYDTWRVSLTLKVPLFDGLRTSGKRAQNRAVIEQIRQNRVDTERLVQVQQASARREVGKAQAFLEAATKAHDAGQEALRVSRESFAEGLISSLDLLQAERQERQLESQRVQAQLAVWSALLDLRRSLGLAPL